VADSAPHVERPRRCKRGQHRVNGREDQGAAVTFSPPAEGNEGLFVQDLGRFPQPQCPRKARLQMVLVKGAHLPAALRHCLGKQPQASH